MLPKDLLTDLESGDRTSEHLETKESPEATINIGDLQSLQNAIQLRQGFNSFATTSAGNLWAYQNTQTGQLGGITRW